MISYKLQMVFQLTETWPKPGSYWQYIAFHKSIFCTIRGSLNKGMSYPLSHPKAHECIWRELCPKTNSISEFIAILQLSAGDIIYNMVQLCKTMYNSGFRECPPWKITNRFVKFSTLAVRKHVPLHPWERKSKPTFCCRGVPSHPWLPHTWAQVIWWNVYILERNGCFQK